jgi:hypothetical protein
MDVDANQMQNFILNQVTWDTHAVYATQVAQGLVLAESAAVAGPSEASNCSSHRVFRSGAIRDGSWYGNKL